MKFGFKLIHRCDVAFTAGVPEKIGGHGVVKQAVLDGEIVAVKCPKDQCSLTEREFKKFVEELHVMASVCHPNCVMLRAACKDRNNPMYVMEWVGGGSLHEALGKEEPLPCHVRLKIAREITSAVDYLHKCKIVHGDLKSLNVLLTPDYIAKICDFGSAIQTFNSTVNTKSGSTNLHFSTTVQWSSPELLRTGVANEMTDMYALGVIFWELATCEVPFRNKAPALLMSLIMNGLTPEIPHPLPDTAVGLPPLFFQVMLQCFRTDPALRPDAHTVHQMLISIDPTARPSAPLLICPPGHPVPKGSLLECVRHAMPPSLDCVVVRMMAFAEDLFKRSPRAKEIQSFCAMYSIWDIEAYTLMVRLFFFALNKYF